MPASKLAKAMRCPFDWFEPLKDKTPTCKRGDDCNECIRKFLMECDDNDFKPQ
jgi:hypothetical protein